VANGLGNLRDRLHAGSPRSNHGHPFARKLYRLVRPGAGVVGLTREIGDAGDCRHGRCRQRPDRGDQEARARSPAIFEHDLPSIGANVVASGCHAAVEGDVAAQVELVGHLVAVAQRLRLRREVLAPIPLPQQLVGKREPVGPAFRIEPRARVAVPVPSSADAITGLEYLYREAELAHAVELVHARQAGANDDDIAIHALRPDDALPASPVR
jgi:hypothetical protein